MLKKFFSRFAVAILAGSVLFADSRPADAYGFGYYGLGRPLGVGYSGFGYSPLGWGGWGYPAYRGFNLSINVRRPLLGHRWSGYRPLHARAYSYYRPSYSYGYASSYYASNFIAPSYFAPSYLAQSYFAPSYLAQSYYAPSYYGAYHSSYATPTYPAYYGSANCGVSPIYCQPTECYCCDTTSLWPSASGYGLSSTYLPSSTYTPAPAYEYEVVPNAGVIQSTVPSMPSPAPLATPLLDGDLQIRTTPQYEPAREDWMKLADRAIERMATSGDILDAEVAVRQLLAIDAKDRQRHLQAGVLALLNGRSSEIVAADFAAARDADGRVPTLTASFRAAVGLQDGQTLEPFIQQASRKAIAELETDASALKTYLVSTAVDQARAAEQTHSQTILDTLLRIDQRDGEADAIAAALSRQAR